MTIREFKNQAIFRLHSIYGEKESASISDILLEWATGKGKGEIFAGYDQGLGPDEQLMLEGALSELLLNRPVQYITGRTWFYDLLFKVDERVLIPRPETEELVKWILDDHSPVQGLRVLDVGTGSGCIAISLAKHLGKAEVTAIDISGGALEVSRHNAGRMNVAVGFIQADILKHEDWSRFSRYGIIVSNPPYVRHSEKSWMMPNVHEYEPPEALFVPDDEPLVFYRAIADFARGHLLPGGRLYLEINEALGQKTIELLLETGFTDVLLRQDLHGKDRMVRASN